jgi:3-hydroxyisobutyrate dehydrogenase-like beta-hydroxyacid dehydrogenase
MSTDHTPSLALLGLGRMGLPMAGHLLDRFGDLIVWNRSADKARELVARGATLAATPREAATDVALTVLTDLSDVEAVLHGEDGLLRGWEERKVEHPVLVVHGTVSPVRVAELAARLAERGISLLDAPLSGGVAGAQNATLSIMVGGRREDAERLAPVFDALGSTVRHLGPSGSGELAKACNQVVVAATVSALSEALLLARASGLDVETMIELLGGGLAASEVLRQKKDKWIREDFEAGGTATNQLKDLRFVGEAAAAASLVLPVSNAVTALFAGMVGEGDGELDHTGVYRQLERLGEGNRNA